MSYPLPISPHDPAFADFCVGQQMAYIGAERWRYTRALRFKAWEQGDLLADHQWLQWATLGLHPQTPEELQARLDRLDEMETAALARDDRMLGSIELGATLAKQPR